MSDSCKVYSIGQMEYVQAWILQKTLIDHRVASLIPDTLLLLEHPHVFTIGRRGTRADILIEDKDVSLARVPIFEVDRGGETTYHGPGQLIGYPIFALAESMGPVKFVRALENTLIEALDKIGIISHRVVGKTGVWVTDPTNFIQKKIGAIGVRFSKGVTSHGFALNVNTELRYFDHIIACGIENLPVTSVAEQLGSHIDMQLVCHEVAKALARTFGVKPNWADSVDLQWLLEEARS